MVKLFPIGSTEFQGYSSDLFPVTAGSHTIAFHNTVADDAAAYIDMLTLDVPVALEPASVGTTTVRHLKYDSFGNTVGMPPVETPRHQFQGVWRTSTQVCMVISGPLSRSQEL